MATGLQATAADLILWRSAALYAAAAYPDGPPLPGRKVTPLVAGQFRAIAIEEPGSLTISLAGTDSLQNFLTDAACVMVPLMGNDDRILCHKGFWEGQQALWTLILPWLETNRLTLKLRGHSLGAAIARLLLVRMYREMGMRPADIITIGEPRSLNWFGAQFADELGVKSQRLCNKYDVITRIPLWNLRAPQNLFRHTKHSVWLDPEGGIDIDENWIRKIPQDIRGFRQELKARKGDVLIGDHSAKQYQATLDSLVIK